MQKVKKIGLSLVIVSALSLGIVGCGGGGGGSSSTANDNTSTTKTISGQAIDGYISGAKVCLDINKNNSCEDNEPSTTTDNNGVFSLSTNLSGEYPIVIFGGTDIATGETFDGTLKNVIKLSDTSTKIDTKITPLTTLVANIIQDDSTISLNQAKQTIADNLGLTVSDIEKDPMKDQKIFVKTQQIINTVKVLSESIQKDENDTGKRKQAFDHIMKQVSLSIKEDINSKDVNISKIITQVENTTYDENTITIPDEVETFTKDFSNEIKTKAGSTLDVNNLSDLQNGFNGYINKAKEKIKNSTISTLKDITEEVKATTTTILTNKKEAFVIPEHIVVDKNKTKIFHKLSPLYFGERKAYFDDRKNALKGINHLLAMASYGNAFLSGGTSEVAKETTKNLVYDSLDGLGVEGVTSEILLKLTDKFTGIIASKNPLASLKLETINSIVDMGATLGSELATTKLTEQTNSGTMAQYLLTLYYEHNENWKDVNYFLNIQQNNLTQDTFDAVNKKYQLNMNGMNLGALDIVVFDDWVVKYDPDSVIKIINKVGSIVNTIYDNLPDNKKPIAIIEQDSINTEGHKVGDTVDFTASKSSDSDGTILHYYWYLDSPNSSTTKILTNCEDNQYCSITLDKAGDYSVKLQVEDDSEAISDIDSIELKAKDTISLTYSWQLSSWSSCQGSCGTNNGTKTRTVTCKDSDGNSVDDSLCTDTKPSLTQSCTASECANEQTGTITHNGFTYGTITSSVTGKVWLDRNLGASRVCQSFDDEQCYGDYYQWGRNADGHEKSNSSTTSTQATSTSNVGHGNFITSSSSYDYDWAKDADSDGSLRSSNWSAIDGSNVCPLGYRIPTIDELLAESIDNRADAYSKLKLPSAGYRDWSSGSLYEQGSYGYVWSSSLSGSYSKGLGFISGVGLRAGGHSVRCVRD